MFSGHATEMYTTRWRTATKWSFSLVLYQCIYSENSRPGVHNWMEDPDIMVSLCGPVFCICICFSDHSRDIHNLVKTLTSWSLCMVLYYVSVFVFQTTPGMCTTGWRTATSRHVLWPWWWTAQEKASYHCVLTWPACWDQRDGQCFAAGCTQ